MYEALPPEIISLGSVLIGLILLMVVISSFLIWTENRRMKAINQLRKMIRLPEEPEDTFSMWASVADTVLRERERGRILETIYYNTDKPRATFEIRVLARLLNVTSMHDPSITPGMVEARWITPENPDLSRTNVL